ncbi:hypothetical protein BJY04DRAFT_214367 [Aspergillus karnatakaensis]|uniref:putative histone h1.3 n=1 Tax=Aspergillus karnatakaensis TaxID=1810916 RepID=UPI003CCCF06E
MATPVKGKAEGIMGLSNDAARLLLLGMLCSDNTGTIDFEKLTLAGGYKNAKSASSAYRQVKKRFCDSNSNIVDSPAAAPIPSSDAAESPNKPLTPPKRTPTKRKAASAAIVTDSANATGTNTVEDEQLALPTPKPKRQRKAPAKKAAAVKAEAEDDGDQNTGIKSEPKISDIDNTTPGGEIPKSKSLKSEEADVMTELDIDNEFLDMERNQTPTKAEGGNCS